MVERLRPAPVSCNETAWRELLFAMNGSPDRILVRTDSLERVLECHRNKGNKISIEDLGGIEQGNKYTAVNRKLLFTFVQNHGGICEHTN